jgi:DNA-directed RNA polymerase
MGDVLREQFVELHEQDLLGQLRDSLSLRFPHLDFPPVPARGNLDIRKVQESRYFFQ